MGLNIHSMECTVDPNITPTAIGQHWTNTTTGEIWFSVGTSSVGDWKKIDGDTDEKVGVSSNDTSPGYLLDKIVAGSTKVTLSEINDGADEDLSIDVDVSEIDHGTLAGLGDDDHTQYLNETRHDALSADNPHSVTFTQAVAADGGTNITAAEAETLTNGSNADLLHNHIETDEKAGVSSNDTTPGYLFDKIQAGTNVTITENNDGGNETLTIATNGALNADLAGVQVGRTTDYILTSSYVDITFNVTEVENKPAVLEHDNTNTDRILLKEGGIFQVAYCTPLDIGSAGRFDFRIRKNDSVVIPGSESYREDSGDTFLTGCSHIFEADADDFISIQVMKTGGSATLKGIGLNVIKLEGAEGAAGPTGAGSNIIVQKDDVTVGTVSDTLNFEGSGVTTVVDEGSNKTTVTIAGGSGDYSDGGEAGGADRSLGNTDNYDLDIKTNNISRIKINGDGRVGINCEPATGYTLSACNGANANGLFVKSGENLGDISVHIEDDDHTFDILEIESDQGYVTQGKTYAQTLSDNGVVYGLDNQLDGTTSKDINTQEGVYRIGGKATVMMTEFDDAESEGESSTTSTSEQTKVTITTPSLPLGKYRIGWYYEWNGSSGSQDVEVQVYDGGTVLARHEEAPEDTDAWDGQGGFKYISSISGVHNFYIKYKTQSSSATARIRRARLEIWRVS